MFSKKFIHVILFLIFPLALFSQDWKELFRKANLYKEYGQNDSALVYSKKALNSAEKLYGLKDTTYARSLSLWGVINYAHDSIYKAEPVLLNSLEIYKDASGENYPGYISMLYSLGEYYNLNEKYVKAIDVLNEALKHCKKTEGENNFLYILILQHLAESNLRLQKYAESEAFYIKAADICKDLSGKKKNLYYSNILSSLGNVYTCWGKFSKAEPLLVKSLYIARKTIGVNNTSYALYQTNLARLYAEMSRYNESEILFRKGILIYRKNSAGKVPAYADILCESAKVYLILGNFTKAEKLYLEALQLRKEFFGEDHLSYIENLDDLASLYIRIKKYTVAQSLLQKALEIGKDIYGIKQHNYAQSLYHTAIIDAENKQYAAAEEKFKEILKILWEINTVNHPLYSACTENLGLLYYLSGNYLKSDSLFQVSLLSVKKIYGENHLEYAKLMQYIGNLNFTIRNTAKAEECYLKANQCFMEHMQNSFSYLSEYEQLQFLSLLTGNIKYLYSFALKQQKENPEITGVIYNNELTIKGALLRAGKQMREVIINSKDSSLVNLIDLLQEKRQKLSKLYLTNMVSRINNIGQLEEESNEIEKLLYSKSADFKNYKDFGTTGWQEIKKKLKDDEASLEFVRFPFYNRTTKKFDCILYCVLILKNNYQFPQMIPLFKEKTLNEALSDISKTDRESINKMYSQIYQGKSSDKHKGAKKAISLYSLIFKPFEEELKGVKSIYISPSGLLNRISFAAISMPDKRFLAELYNIINVSSTREIANNETDLKPSSGLTAAVYGGIRYNSDSLTMKKNAAIYYSNNTHIPIKDTLLQNVRRPEISNLRSGWSELNSTKEADNINALFVSNKIKTKEYTGEKANEESFKALGKNNSPTIIHISTHGYCISDTLNESGIESILSDNFSSNISINNGIDDPLLRSGLIFAGANRVWKGGGPLANTDDGILTAYEVSNLNLRNTKLITLSACQTGLGDIKGTEGVFGLQRAFKIAGVENIILSLWNVSKTETSDFMLTFYNKLLKESNIRNAFRQTQQEMLKKYKEPFRWAAFQLIE